MVQDIPHTKPPPAASSNRARPSSARMPLANVQQPQHVAKPAREQNRGMCHAYIMSVSQSALLGESDCWQTNDIVLDHVDGGFSQNTDLRVVLLSFSFIPLKFEKSQVLEIHARSQVSICCHI